MAEMAKGMRILSVEYAHHNGQQMAKVKMALAKQHFCEQCCQPYTADHVEQAFHGVLGLPSAANEKKALAGASKRAAGLLEKRTPLSACPKCGLLQTAMVRQFKLDRRMSALALGILVTLGLVALPIAIHLSETGMRNWGKVDRDLIGAGLALGVLTTIIAVFVHTRKDPNADLAERTERQIRAERDARPPVAVKLPPGTLPRR
jgi:hypothetical protein